MNADPPPPVAIRRAIVADAARLSDAARTMFEQTFGPANTPEDMRAYLASAFTPAIQSAELADPDRVCWLAEDQTGAIVGYALVRRASTSNGVNAERPAEVQRIYVDRMLHGRRVGDALMAACVEQAQAWGCDVLWLAVWEKNPRAIAFYGRLGFEPVGRQTFKLGNDLQQDMVMARNLSS